MIFSVHVEVRLREGIADPQGSTIERALPSLGFDGVESVRSGKFFQVRVRAKDEKKAGKQVAQMCARLLANPVIESYRIEVA